MLTQFWQTLQEKEKTVPLLFDKENHSNIQVAYSFWINTETIWRILVNILLIKEKFEKITTYNNIAVKLLSAILL